MSEAATVIAPPRQAYVEIARFHHADPTKACADVLEAAGIPYRLSNDSLTQGVGLTQLNYIASCIVTVPAGQVVPARKALLQAAREEVADGVGPEPPLATSDNEVLLDVLRHPEESGEYDIAVAERLLRARGVTPPEVSLEVPVTPPPGLDASLGKEEEPLPGTRHANVWVVIFGFIFAGILIGVIVAWNLALATEPVPGQPWRKRWVYDEASRRQGTIMLYWWLVVLLVWLVLLMNVWLGSFS